MSHFGIISVIPFWADLFLKIFVFFYPQLSQHELVSFLPGWFSSKPTSSPLPWKVCFHIQFVFIDFLCLFLYALLTFVPFVSISLSLSLSLALSLFFQARISPRSLGTTLRGNTRLRGDMCFRAPLFDFAWSPNFTKSVKTFRKFAENNNCLDHATSWHRVWKRWVRRSMVSRSSTVTRQDAFPHAWFISLFFCFSYLLFTSLTLYRSFPLLLLLALSPVFQFSLSVLYYSLT